MSCRPSSAIWPRSCRAIRSETYLNDALFARIEALNTEADKLGLSAEQARVLARYHLNFTRAGAGLPSETKTRLAAISERLATLGAEFGQNVLADEKAWLVLLDEDDLDGLPDFFVASAARIAAVSRSVTQASNESVSTSQSDMPLPLAS